MIHVLAPASRRLVWYLAMEEYLAQSVSEDILFTWVVHPTVIFGRHQVMEDEVNIDYCRSHNVQMYRRKSGGGCVYADGGNLMLSYITPNTHVEQVFQHYLDTMVSALQGLGIVAVKSEHNDILVEGRKVSGNACYALQTGTIVHGTLLYNVDFVALQQAITPTREKLSKHGISSVRQRVSNLLELQQLQPSISFGTNALHSIFDLSDYICNHLCSSSRTLTAEEISAIDAIEQTYLEPAFICGK
ncbi:MAG: biotin/lipoate A/B protein ligase family protein [Paludibacteraceae bacterium]